MSKISILPKLRSNDGPAPSPATEAASGRPATTCRAPGGSSMKLASRIAATFVILAPLSFPSVAAAVDLSATYRMVVVGINCLVTFTQTGTVLSLSGSCSSIVGKFNATGTVDTGTGAFFATGQADNLCTSPGSLAFSGTGDGTTISGSVTCDYYLSFFGSTCGNDTIDAG